MKTLVIGANGKIGRQFCELARTAGLPVKAMIRDSDQQTWFRERGIETVIADLEGSLRHAFYGCDQVVFAAGSGPHTGPDKTLMIDLNGAIRAIDLAAELGLSRFLMVSAIRAETPLDGPEKLRPYLAAKHAADDHLRASRVPYVIAKPGRLTDEAATLRLATSPEEAGDNHISRANVAHALLYLAQERALTRREFALLDGERRIGDALA
ncbi:MULTISPECIES: SDR family oxidoreductase [unclassified Modicisalibacter]|uniref:SDR family oxidoreductase n=1 Tax=unclassified Modicisalibacter TaxID=2679913 RepID=UPI001CD03DFF|nr:MULTISPECIES: SDR family oxidoreductase [unclassified Modicisalibacter]MBZ9560045.1 SDR family oxidoreductase [Modicisalibacter sp. R2A 31.J]MBZ9575954.1 SDR family oxidoreductase [Modicisalibacter sp. MOD 31.J]